MVLHEILYKINIGTGFECLYNMPVSHSKGVIAALLDNRHSGAKTLPEIKERFLQAFFYFWKGVCTKESVFNECCSDLLSMRKRHTLYKSHFGLTASLMN